MKFSWFLLLSSLLLTYPLEAQRGGGRGRGGMSSLEQPPVPKSDAEKRILKVIAEVRGAGATHLEVPDTDGRMIRLLAESINAKNLVEIGTSMGMSGLWTSLALVATGGKLTTFELDPDRAAQARKHFEQAGVDKLITVVVGDAHANLAKHVTGSVDFVFIDAEKEGYVDYLNQMLPRVRPGGLILAHNTNLVPDYIKAVTTNPSLETLFYTNGAGLSVSLKKR